MSIDWKKLAKKAAKWLGRKVEAEVEQEVEKRLGGATPPEPSRPPRQR